MIIKKVLDTVEKIIYVLLTILFSVMVAAIFGQIIARFVFHTAISWAEELTRYSFVWLSMLGGAIAIRKGSHMKVDFFTDLMPKNVRKIVDFIINALVLTFFSIMTIYGSKLVQMTFKQKVATLPIPMSIPYLAVPVGGILMIIFTIESLLNKRNQTEIN